MLLFSDSFKEIIWTPFYSLFVGPICIKNIDLHFPTANKKLGLSVVLIKGVERTIISVYRGAYEGEFIGVQVISEEL